MHTQSVAKKLLRVGFDLDGVLLYNPARIFRPITVFAKKIMGSTDVVSFYYPKSSLEQLLWRLIHLSSFTEAAGYERIAELVQEGAIEAHIITGRFACLEKDLNRWVRRMKADRTFKTITHNGQNLQNHIYKADRINELKLDYYVEDNWDIVIYLTQHTNAKIFWITNVLDHNLSYPYKFNTLHDAIQALPNRQ